MCVTLAGVALGQNKKSPSYVYRALVTQVGTNHPVADVAETTLPFTLTFERLHNGLYLGLPSGGVFPPGKLLVRLTPGGATSTTHAAYIYDNAIWIETLQLRYIVQAGQSVFFYTDNALTESFLEIYFYPAN